MSPWQELTWFEPLSPVLVSPPSKGSLPLCAANPRRVVLVMSNTVGAAAFASVGSDPGGNNTNGWSMQGTYQTIVLTQKDHGPLCQAAWWVSIQLSPATVYVIEGILRDWPAGEVETNANIANWLRSKPNGISPSPPLRVSGPGGFDTDT